MSTSMVEGFADILLQRRRVIIAPEGSVDPAKKAVFLSELFQLGYQVVNPELYSDAVLDSYRSVMDTVERLKGGTVSHVPLYSGFPDEIPDEGDYLLKRLLGYVIKHARWDVPGEQLETGYTVPRWLFDLELFGADPVSQFQDKSLFLKAKWAQFKRRSEKPEAITELSFVRPNQAVEELKEWARRCLSSKTSYPEPYREDLTKVVAAYGCLGLTAQELVFREHRALVSAQLWHSRDWESLRGLCQTPTDLLRLFAQLTGGDISLLEPISHPRFKRKERRFILDCLERMRPHLVVEAQLHKYRGLWIQLERSLHSGEYAKLFPKTYLLFRKLQNGQTQAQFAELEKAFGQSESSPILSQLAKLPPGVSLRRFAQALSVVEPDQRGATLDALLPTIEKAQLKDQLMLSRVIRRDGTAQKAMILTKRGATQAIPRDPTRLPPDFRQECLERLEESLKSCATKKFGADSWAGKKVFIEPELAQWVVPLALRSASDALTVMGRGTRVALGSKPTVRLFVYWKQRFRRTDLDLSAVTFDGNLKCTGYVDWTRLKGNGVVHSGDLQSAPYGAAEFIDVNIEKIQQTKATRYLACVVFRYCGDNFGTMESFTGWMTRDKPNAAYKSFDISTVRQKLELAGQPSYSVPFVIDLRERQVTWLDLSVYSLAQHSQVANSFKRLEQLVEAGSGLANWRPTLAELARLHVETRGAGECEDRSGADLVFARDAKADYGPHDWSKVLSELL